MERRHAERGEFQKALEGLDFPASRDAIVQKARDKGGLDTEVPFTLERIEPRTYESLADVEAAVDAVYAEQGGLASGGPAAPSRESERGKDAIERGADPRSE
jgi:hypothetical protein